MADLPTPEELGERLKRGDITREEAIEIMSERARREALQNLYGPAPDKASGSGAPDPMSSSMKHAGSWIIVAVIALLALLYVILKFIG